jgi:hypothetical protein
MFCMKMHICIYWTIMESPFKLMCVGFNKKSMGHIIECQSPSGLEDAMIIDCLIDSFKS